MSPPSPSAGLASVVVPTRDRPDQLAACLDALAAQTTPPGEVVVVDDGSVDPDAVADVVAARPSVRLLRAAGRGPAAARNLGAANARGPIVCFTDDDCRPDPHWLGELVEALDDAATVAAGPTRNGRTGDPFAEASQTITNHLLENSIEPATADVGFAPTCNIACRSSVLAAVPFDEGFPLAAGEDRDWCSRLADHGIGIRLVPDAIVAHHPDLPRRAFWRQHVRYGRGAVHWRRRRPRSAGRQRPRFYLELVRRAFATGAIVGILVLVAQLATAQGVATELLGSTLPADRPT